MGDKNFHTFIDFGKNEIRACSFNKETEKIENQFELIIKSNQSKDLLSEEELVEEELVEKIDKEFETFRENFIGKLKNEQTTD